MIGLQTIAVAFAMFSALPVPQFAWNEKTCGIRSVPSRWGGFGGALWCLCGALPLPMPPRQKRRGSALIPVWVTGGIHLDGYADTCDALSSYGDREKKLEILKDPHCGAFAVIRLCSYFAAYLALCACVDFTPRVGALLDTGPCFGAGVLRPCGGGLSPGQKHRPCPHLCHGGGSDYGAPGAGSAGDTALWGAAGFGRRALGWRQCLLFLHGIML